MGRTLSLSGIIFSQTEVFSSVYLELLTNRQVHGASVSLVGILKSGRLSDKGFKSILVMKLVVNLSHIIGLFLVGHQNLRSWNHGVLNKIAFALIDVIKNLIFIDLISLDNAKLNKHIFLVLNISESRTKKLNTSATFKRPRHRSDSEEVNVFIKSECKSTKVVGSINGYVEDSFFWLIPKRILASNMSGLEVLIKGSNRICFHFSLCIGHSLTIF